MKKYFSKISLILATVLMVSCSEDVKVFDVDGGITAYHFVTATQTFGVSPIANEASVNVGVTTRSSVERQYQVSVVAEETTAADGAYTVDTSSLVIAPNSFTGSFNVDFNFNLIPVTGSVRLVLLLTPESGTVLAGKSKLVITVSRVCPLGTESIAGAHTYSSFDLVRGQSATPTCDATPSGTVTWTATATAGLYSTSDMAFGMYQNCWGVAAGAVSASSRVRWVCNQVNAEGTDQYGDGFTYTITNCSGSELSISWTNAYGDSGKTIITRAGGAAWPALLQN